MFFVFTVSSKNGVDAGIEDELEGLDMPEMGVLAYPESDASPAPAPGVDVSRRPLRAR